MIAMVLVWSLLPPAPDLFIRFRVYDVGFDESKRAFVQDTTGQTYYLAKEQAEEVSDIFRQGKGVSIRSRVKILADERLWLDFPEIMALSNDEDE